MGRLTELQETRVALLEALDPPQGDSSDVAAGLLTAHEKAAAVTVAHDSRPTALAWQAFSDALKASSRLAAWREAVRQAETDASRYLESAHLIALEALQKIDVGDPAHTAVGHVLTDIAAISTPAEVDDVLVELKRVALPMPLSRPPRAPAVPGATTQRDPQPQAPIAVALFELAGDPAPDATIVRANHFHDLKLELRVTAWPDWADELHATAVSVAGDSASFPAFSFARPEGPDDDGMWSVSDTGKLVIKAVQPLGDKPLTFRLLVEFTSSADGRREAVRTVGQSELQLWSSDDSPTSLFTGIEQLDVRVAEILAQIHDNPAFGTETERGAFTRFLGGLLKATQTLQNRRAYSDATPDERRFQSDLLMLLDQQEALGRRVQEGTEIGGGETDLVHENIVAELKVAKDTTVTEENAPKYLGQTTSYGSGLGAQLGIAVILDLSEKKSPLGHPANYVYFLEPKLHGVTDPHYPSHVAVLVVNGNTPLPSDFAGKKVEVADEERDS